MFKNITFLFFFFVAFYLLKAQILPKEGSALNYRLIGFSFPNAENAKNYKLEIARGNYFKEDSFEKNIIKRVDCKEKKIITEVPAFGDNYTWRIIYPFSKSKMINEELHHFSTLIIPEADTNNVRLRILQGAKKYKDAFVLLDNNKVMYDMNGRPVWFLPDKIAANMFPMDMRLSPEGTITLLLSNAYEINYDGDILWKAPDNGDVNGNKVENYHHEFTRLANGHYMVLGTEWTSWDINLHAKENRQNKEDDTKVKNKDSNTCKTGFGTIIEYDEKGNVVWSWKSSSYFTKPDIDLNELSGAIYGGILDVHENAFYFDEKNKDVYVGFKNLNEILKLKYPEGKVINTYGKTDEKGSDFFCGQHSISRSEDGHLLIYNNNSCNRSEMPTIIEMEETSDGSNKLKKDWEYSCTMDADYPKKLNRGGIVTELDNHSLFVCIGGSYGKVYIVNKDKKILWSALPERWNKDERKWEVIAQYRASIIKERKYIDKLIWNNK